jgi:hypothetical protein
MKKLIISFLVIILLSVISISWKKASGGAVIINEFVCGLYDADGNVVITDNSHAVVNPSGNGMLRCEAEVPNSTGRAVIFNNLSCVTFAGFTKGTEVISASGHATLMCHVNGHFFE